MYTKQLLDLLDDKWPDRYVELVTFPAPPTPAKGVLYAEDSWRSDVLERGMSIFNSMALYQVLDARFTERGPAFLIRRRLEDIIRTEDGIAVVPNPIYCATISYATLLEQGNLVYASDSVLENVREIESSCHPASHTVAPGAPFLTSWLELRYAADGRRLPQDFVFADHDMAERYFPKRNFQANRELDQIFKYLTLDDCLVHHTQTTFQLYPVISGHLRQHIATKLVSNTNLHRRQPDLYKYIALVDDLQHLTTGV